MAKAAPAFSSEVSFFSMAIFTTDISASEARLRQTLKELDNSSGPKGSGGFIVKEHNDNGDCYFSITERDCEPPAASGMIWVKKGFIWAPLHFYEAIYNLLRACNIGFKFHGQDFFSQETAKAAFKNS